MQAGVDAVSINSWDGRVRLEQTVDVLRARKVMQGWPESRDLAQRFE